MRQAGADEVIISPDLKFSAEVWRLTDKQGVDVVLENVVTGTFDESLRSCAQHATIVVLGNIGARPVELDPGLVICGASALPGPAMRRSRTCMSRCISSPPGGQAVHRPRAAVPASGGGPRVDRAACRHRARRACGLVTCTSARNGASSRDGTGSTPRLSTIPGRWRSARSTPASPASATRWPGLGCARRPDRAARSRCPRISRGRLRHHVGWLRARAARSPPDRRGIVGTAALRRRDGVGHARLLAPEGRRAHR